MGSGDLRKLTNELDEVGGGGGRTLWKGVWPARNKGGENVRAILVASHHGGEKCDQSRGGWDEGDGLGLCEGGEPCLQFWVRVDPEWMWGGGGKVRN